MSLRYSFSWPIFVALCTLQVEGQHLGSFGVAEAGYTSGLGFRQLVCGFRRRRTLIPKGTRTAFRAEGEQRSERSDAGTSIVQEVFGFVKKNLSGAIRSAAEEARL